MKRAALMLVAVGLAGCGNTTGFLDVPKKSRPVAVIDAPAGPLAALSVYVADGSSSHDSDGHIVAWHWTVPALPAGSRIELLPDPATGGAKVSFQPDLLGSYQIRLVVTDDDGLDSLPAVYEFGAQDDNGLRIELTWDRDYTDVDLHLVDETAGGTFFSEPYDCYFQNRAPDWGVAGSTDDDPVLPFDQDEGYGPEVIGIHTPAAATYHVFANYYCDDGFGGTGATIRLYANGALQTEAHSTLVHTGDLWDVATVQFAADGTATMVVSTAAVVSTAHGCN